jgi:guanine deaminase
MLKTGATAVVDHFRQTPMRMEAIAAAVAAYREIGMRAAIAVMLRDKPVPKDPADRNGERQSPSDVAEIARLCEEAIERWHDPRTGITLMLGPSAPHRCTDQLLAEIARISDQRDVSVHMHVDETHRDRDTVYALYKKSSIQHLREVGLLGPRLSVAHAVWVDEADMDLLSDSGSMVVHNPVSNARLGSGLAPVADLHRRGVTVALGTDGAASNDSQNVLEAIKCAALTDALRAGMARDSGREREPIKASELAAMATRAGGRLFGGGHGMLTLGAAADIAVLEMEEPPLRPVDNVYRHLVYAGTRLRARHVFVGGKQVVDNGRITTIDEATLHREARDLVREIYP